MTSDNRSAEKAAKLMAQVARERAEKRKQDKGMARGEGLDDRSRKVSDWMLANLTAFAEFEASIPDGITRADLGEMMGFQPKVIYTRFRSGMRLGMTSLMRLAEATGTDEYIWIMPPDKFKSHWLDDYMAKRQKKR